MRRRHGQRGFAMASVVLLTGLGVLGVAILLDVIEFDTILGTHRRQTEDAREAAEGAVMEVINDIDTTAQLPNIDDTDLIAAYSPSSSRTFGDGKRGNATVELALLRVVPVPESSALKARAVVYEISSRASSGSQGTASQASYDVRAEVFRIISYKQGTVMPRRHAR